MNIVAIHQPNYLPWSGYFYKIAKCDYFVFLDDVVMASPGFTNRNRIKTKDGVMWLTVPCKHDFGRSLIKDVECADDRWRRQHIRTLEMNYGKTPHFETYIGRLREIILSNERNISNLNVKLIEQIARWLGLSCSFQLSSRLDVSGTGDDRLINLVARLGGGTYLSGSGGAHYQSELKFSEAAIKLLYYDFEPPAYPQLWGPFEAGLSAIDLLFNTGPDSQRILRQSGRTKR